MLDTQAADIARVCLGYSLRQEVMCWVVPQAQHEVLIVTQWCCLTALALHQDLHSVRRCGTTKIVCAHFYFPGIHKGRQLQPGQTGFW